MKEHYIVDRGPSYVALCGNKKATDGIVEPKTKHGVTCKTCRKLIDLGRHKGER